MLNFPRWKVIMILATCLFGVLAALPNFLSEAGRAELPGFLPSKTLSLGLDLQGGVHLLWGAETEEVVKSKLDNLAGQIADLRRSERKLNFQNIRQEGHSIVFNVTRDEMVEEAREKLRPLTQNSVGAVNAMLGGGVQELELSHEGRVFRLTLTDQGIEVQKRDAISRAMEVMRKRVDPEGTREILLQPQGSDRIILEVPGASDPEEIKKKIGKTAKLTFHDVATNVSQDDVYSGRTIPGVTVMNMKEGGKIALRNRVIVSGDDLTDAKASYDDKGQPAVAFAFNTAGAKRFGSHTKDNVGRQFAIVLDNQVISAPTIIVPIMSGSGQITNMGTIKDAQELATLLKAGALPVKLTVLEQRTVGPDLGKDAVESGEIAAVIGFIAVVVYMTLCYGLFGIAANIALIVNVVLIMGFLSLFQATLTLPGIAGIVLTIGMAVDANVLVFERIREEQAAGRKPFDSMAQGYGQALSTILDANITTFIAAAILYLLGSGPVQGFAVTLAIGILTSVFTAVVLTRLMLSVWLKRTRPATLPI